MPQLTKRYNRVKADFGHSSTRNSSNHKALISENQRLNQLIIADRQK